MRSLTNDHPSRQRHELGPVSFAGLEPHVAARLRHYAREYARQADGLAKMCAGIERHERSEAARAKKRASRAKKFTATGSDSAQPTESVSSAEVNATPPASASGANPDVT